MNSYPEVVAKIARDYLDRLKSQLQMVPLREQQEFLAEIESHLYEAYQHSPEEDEVARILAVLRNLGEPAEVVSDRLPRTMAQSGASRSLPLYILGGVLIALFGIPLGFGGLGVLVGILAAVSGILLAFYAAVGSIALVGALFLLLGLGRMVMPQTFDRLVMLGYIQIGFLDRFPRSEQDLLIILFGCVCFGGGLGLLWLGRHLFRGLRFLFALFFDWMRRFAQVVRSNLRRHVPHPAKFSPGLAR